MPAVVSSIACTPASSGVTVIYTGSLTTFTQGTDSLPYDTAGSAGTLDGLRTLKYENYKWVDTNSGNQPVLVDSSGTGISETGTNPQTVYVTWYGSNVSFANPYYSSGGVSTNSEGSSNPSGSFYFNSQSQLVFVVNSTSPSSDGNIVYKIFRRTVNQVMGHAYTVTHSNGSPTEFSIGLDLSLYDRWELRVESSTALVDSATMSVYSTAPKKVFCNFW